MDLPRYWYRICAEQFGDGYVVKVIASDLFQTGVELSQTTGVGSCGRLFGRHRPHRELTAALLDLPGFNGM